MANIPKYFYFRVNPTKAGIELEDASDVDVVEVVRCKDCKFNPNDTWFDCPMAHLPYKEDRWCWKGERKDDQRRSN